MAIDILAPPSGRDVAAKIANEAIRGLRDVVWSKNSAFRTRRHCEEPLADV